MSFYKRIQDHFRQYAILAGFVLALVTAPAEVQTSPTSCNTAAADSTKKIAVAPNVRDTQIADRLKRILDASGWFAPVAVSVREGIVFLDGQTEADDRKEWAQQLALRTQDVVAV